MRRTLVVLVALGVGCGDSGITPEPDDGSSSNTGANTPNGTGTGVGGNGSGGQQNQGGEGQAGRSNEGGTAQGGDGQGGRGEGGRAPTMAGGWYESGTRLKAKTYLGSDGSRTPLLQMRDTMLNVDCFFNRADDDEFRCLPSSGVNVAYFSDAACTQPVGYGTGCVPTSNYAVQQVGSCNTKQRIYNLGNVITPSTIYVGTSANCVSTTPIASFTYYSLGAEVPPSSFVAGTVEIEP